MENKSALLQNFFDREIIIEDNFISFKDEHQAIAYNQNQTKDIFSDKWDSTSKMEQVDKLYETQYKWFLSLYGFETEENLKSYLKNRTFIIDTGCGLGYKSSWFSKLAPHAIVIGIDISDSCKIAAENFKDIPNLFFLQANIAETGLKFGASDFVVCDQVIMHTENPALTFKHLAEITSIDGEFACYFYRKKALPRELIDDYFRTQTHNIPNDKMWEFSEQLTELGKRLSELNVSFESPDIPLLGIKGGEYDIQRFIYWNFLKCYWNEEWGFDLSKITNFDWYAPSNAQRFSKEEVTNLVSSNNMKIHFWHEEEACYSGRFGK